MMFKKRILNEGSCMKEVMQITCNWRWSLALEKCSHRSSEWLKEASVKLMRNGGGMRRCKRLLKRRKRIFSHMYLNRSVNNIEQYKVLKKFAKRAVSAAMGQMYDRLYQWRWWRAQWPTELLLARSAWAVSWWWSWDDVSNNTGSILRPSSVSKRRSIPSMKGMTSKWLKNSSYQACQSRCD
jgi:hypothetical protein